MQAFIKITAPTQEMREAKGCVARRQQGTVRLDQSQLGMSPLMREHPHGAHQRPEMGAVGKEECEVV